MKNVIVVTAILIIIGTLTGMVIKELGDYIDELKGND